MILGLIIAILAHCIRYGECFSYGVEDEVETCRLALKSGLITAYVTESNYILMNGPIQSPTSTAVPPVWGTHVTKISQRAMTELMRRLEATVSNPDFAREYADDYVLPLMSSNVPIDWYKFLTVVVIPFIFGAVTALIALYLIW